MGKGPGDKAVRRDTAAKMSLIVDIRELKQLRRRPQRRLQRTIGLMIKTTALHVYHAFQYISLTSTARLRRETS